MKNKLAKYILIAVVLLIAVFFFISGFRKSRQVDTTATSANAGVVTLTADSEPAPGFAPPVTQAVNDTMPQNASLSPARKGAVDESW